MTGLGETRGVQSHQSLQVNTPDGDCRSTQVGEATRPGPPLDLTVVLVEPLSNLVIGRRLIKGLAVSSSDILSRVRRLCANPSTGEDLSVGLS